MIKLRYVYWLTHYKTFVESINSSLNADLLEEKPANLLSKITFLSTENLYKFSIDETQKIDKNSKKIRLT